MLGVDDMTEPNSDGMWRYKIEVSGTGIEEYYEYDKRISTDTVRDNWLDDVAENWSDGIASQFRGNVEVTPLWETQDQTTSEASALPPTTEEQDE
jgi:hypothetical protein